MKSLCQKIDALVTWSGTLLQAPFLLAVRLYWGWHFCQTGWGKLTHLQRTSEFFAGLNIPAPMVNAIAVGFTECVGGALLAIGLASRVVALPLIFTMLVAYVTADNEALRSVFSAPDKFLEAAPFLFFFAALIVLVFGPGKFSVDHLIFNKADKN